MFSKTKLLFQFFKHLTIYPKLSVLYSFAHCLMKLIQLVFQVDDVIDSTMNKHQSEGRSVVLVAVDGRSLVFSFIDQNSF